MCDCKSHSIDTSYIRLAASDLLIAKALKLDEVSQMARAEIRLRKLLEAKWDKHAAVATKLASTMAHQGKSASQIATAIDKEMEKWAKEITSTFNAELAAVYRNARIAGFKKAQRYTTASLQYNVPATTEVLKATTEVLPSFDLVDDAAVQSLEEHNTFWIGEHYNKNISNSIRDTTRQTMIEAGASPAAAGKLMAQRVKDMLGKVVTPTGFTGTSKQYFEGLVANAMTVGRVYGQMRSFAEIGIRRYTIVNPGGSRMCEVCAHLQGKTFELEQGLKQIETELQIDNPEGIKKAHPWLTLNQLKEASPKSGRLAGKAGESDSKALADSGLALPPYHFKCRCTVDISDDIKSFEELKEVGFPVNPKVALSPSLKPTITKPAAPIPKPAPAKKPNKYDKLRAEFVENYPLLSNHATKLPNRYFDLSPTTKYDHNKLAKAIMKSAYSKEDQKIIRQQTQALLQEHGVVMQKNIVKSTSVNAHSLEVKYMPDANGTHDWKGLITLNESRPPLLREGAQRGMFEPARKAGGSVGVRMQHKNAFRTLVHEELHHASPGHSYFKGTVVLEEVTTELSARNILAKHFRDDYLLRYGSYDNYIKPFTSKVSKMLGIKVSEAESVLSEVSLKMHRYDGQGLYTKEKYFKYFTEQLPTYEKGKPVQLTPLAKTRRANKMAKELEEFCDELYKKENPYE